MVRQRNSWSNRLKAVDMYRKVPKDLTESSAIGGTFSLVSMLLLFLLFSLEVRNIFSTTYSTSIEVDHSEDGVIQMNLNLTIPGLSCEFASIDIENVIGQKKHDVHDKTLHKFSLDGAWQGFATTKNSDGLVYDVDESTTDLDHYGNKKYALELTAENFDKALNDAEVLLVDFHAPWCGHCQRLSPLYEHAAHMVMQQRPNRERERKGKLDRHKKHSVALATFDCTIPAHVPICRQNHIQAYPTILVFRQGKSIEHYKGHEVHETYHGMRQAEAMKDFALKVYEEVKKGDKELETGFGTDVDGDNIPESERRTKGCRIEGYLMMQRVPSRVIVMPYSSKHSLNTTMISTDHHITHLSFGRRKTVFRGLNIDGFDEGAYSRGTASKISEDKEPVEFVSTQGKASHGHYLSVVATSLISRFGLESSAYEYTINSNTYEKEVPEIVVSFDLSPMKILVKENPRKYLDGFIGIMALIGGVFSCSIIFEGLFMKAVEELAKKLD